MTTKYKYSLDPSSKKFLCPECNTRNFVRCIVSETGKYISEEFGRCDRQTKCNYHKTPKKENIGYLIPFLSLKSITEKAYKLTDTNGFISIIPKSQILELEKSACWITERYLRKGSISYLYNEVKNFDTGENSTIQNNTLIHTESSLTPSYHSLELLDCIYNNSEKDNLSKFLKTIFSENEVIKATQNYFISVTNKPWKQSTVFWQIDENEKIHSGKVMLYNAFTGKRIKQPRNCINWLHKVIKEPEFNLNQCLFGLHLTREDYDKTIAIVESEKTAVIMSLILPEFLWLATGSKQNLKIELLNSIKRRKIVLYPDKGEFSYWSIKAEELNKTGFTIKTSSFIEEQDCEAGTDLADIYVDTQIGV